jgi:uncharacterized protein YbjT (DUF2867 family)
MPHEARLIVQIPRGGAVEQQLRREPPGADIVIDTRPADASGHIEPSDAGHVVLSVPSPETLTREPDAVRRAIDAAGAGVEPLVVVVEAADELRPDELAVVVDAAGRTSRGVVLWVVGDG